MIVNTFELIKEKLEALDCEAWELAETCEERWEFYFIRHRLDQNRAVNTREYEVRVYKKSDDGQFIGSAADRISPTASPEDIDRVLEKLLYQAGLVKNPYYTITQKQETPEAASGSGTGVREIAGDYIRTLAGIEESDTAYINSYEIFVSGIRRHFLNSNGAEYEFEYPSSEVEVVTNARDGSHEIELHRIYHSGTCDPERLKADIVKVMQYGEDRLKAVPSPVNGRCSVLLSTSDAVPVYMYFADKMHADYVFRRISDWKKGDPVQGSEAEGDLVTIEAVADLPGSSTNYPADSEGSIIYDRYLVRDGIAQDYCGSRQFSQYLGLEKSSLISNIKVSGGKLTEEELRAEAGEYLEIVEFSDFQVDSMSGDIAGEIRLGYWHHDGEVTVVTGGSVSGSMNEAVRDMRFCKETVRYNNRVIPAVTLLKNMRITGVSV